MVGGVPAESRNAKSVNGKAGSGSVRFIGDDAGHALGPRKASPNFPGLVGSLPDGAPLDDPRFPIV